MGVPAERRFLLAVGLGSGIDKRGGHASGFVSLSDRINVNHKIGAWGGASRRFMTEAVAGNITMMHARFATCGNKDDVRQAHPYTIRRNGRTVLWGAHNGQIWNAAASARAHNRPYTVDSRELFELLADDELEAIRGLDGYGVITWMTPNSPTVKLARLADHSEIVVGRLAEGGVAWASTYAILSDAAEFAGMTIKSTFKLDEIGRVYEIHPHGVIITDRDGVKFSESEDMWKSAYLFEEESWTDSTRSEFLHWLEHG